MVGKNAFKDGLINGGQNNEGDTNPPGGLHKGLLFAAKYELVGLHCPTGSTDFYETHSGKGQDPPAAAGASGQLGDYRYAWNSHYVGIQGPIGTNVQANTPYPKTGSGSTTRALDGLFQRDKIIRTKDATDGLSKTLLIGERSGDNLGYITDGWVTGIISPNHQYTANTRMLN